MRRVLRIMRVVVVLHESLLGAYIQRDGWMAGGEGELYLKECSIWVGFW